VTWWAWLLVWVALLGGAGLVFFLLGRDLWRRAETLFADASTAGERFGAVLEQVDTLGAEVARRQEAAVFADPVALRREREVALRRRARQKERRRQELVRSRRRP
jgi:hypothetical protein